MSRIWGAILIACGTSLLGWIAYNHLIEMQPEAEGRSPIIPVMFGIAMIGLGVFRLRRKAV